MVVAGEYKGQTGKLLERQKKKEKVFRDKSRSLYCTTDSALLTNVACTPGNRLRILTFARLLV